jgi:hypothetical protein
MTFDEALAHLLALVGERVEVHVMDAGETPHLVATFGGRLDAGYSMTGASRATRRRSSFGSTRERRRPRSASTVRCSRGRSRTRMARSRFNSAEWSS